MTRSALPGLALESKWEIEERLAHITGYLMTCRTCPACGDHPLGFMVKDEVWVAAGLALGSRQAGWWCRECFERKLGRSLTVDDLKDVPLSDWLFLELLRRNP